MKHEAIQRLKGKTNLSNKEISPQKNTHGRHLTEINNMAVRGTNTAINNTKILASVMLVLH